MKELEIDIEKLARLAHIALSPEEKKRLKTSLLKIVEYFQTIRPLATGSGEKTLTSAEGESLPPLHCPRRKEEEPIHLSLRIEPEYLKTLPNYQDGYFQVPRIME
jgi:aspartyl/glutamyl-tRNA(Asn/Gln) amidotransferase C subunit|uniref:Aspartyl/glutamyl-tRNA amidotransferase subunit C n=1 Tax=candidate division WOR-3 bacterium TaxID=2052148 RepID=A0A7C3YTW0_UNCW3